MWSRARTLSGGQRLLELKRAPHVVLQVLAVFGLDSVQLAVGGILGEKWLDEKLREAVEGSREVLLKHIKVVVRVFHGGVGVAHSAVLVQVLVVLCLVGVLLGSCSAPAVGEGMAREAGCGVRETNRGRACARRSELVQRPAPDH